MSKPTLLMKMTPDEVKAYENYVHTPAEAQEAFLQLVEIISTTPGISAGSSMLDKFIFPNRPGWMRTWIARPGEGKSTILRIIAVEEARRLIKHGLTDRNYVAFITYEESVDSQEVHFQDRQGLYTNEEFWRGKVDVDTAVRSSARRPDLPIYWLGESMMKSTFDSPPMTIDMCLAGMRAIYKEHGLLPSLILLDYAQEIVVEGNTTNRTQKVVSAVGSVIKMAEVTKCPVELGSQAKQTSADMDPPIPTLEDTEYSYYLAQKSQIVVGMWRVWNTHRHRPEVQAHGIKLAGWRDAMFKLNPGLTVFMPNKSRHSRLTFAVPAIVDVEKLAIQDLDEVRRQMLLNG